MLFAVNFPCGRSTSVSKAFFKNDILKLISSVKKFITCGDLNSCLQNWNWRVPIARATFRPISLLFILSTFITYCPYNCSQSSTLDIILTKIHSLLNSLKTKICLFSDNLTIFLYLLKSCWLITFLWTTPKVIGLSSGQWFADVYPFVRIFWRESATQHTWMKSLRISLIILQPLLRILHLAFLLNTQQRHFCLIFLF